MWEWLTRVQTLPEDSRRKVAVISAAVITFVIICAWMLVELVSAPSFEAPLPVAEEKSLESLREDVTRLQEAGSKQVENWKTLMEAFKSQPQGE